MMKLKEKKNINKRTKKKKLKIKRIRNEMENKTYEKL